MNNAAYIAGATEAIKYSNIRRSAQARLRREWEYWEGFHHTRPLTFDIHDQRTLEDPTRPGGFIFRRH